MGEWGPPKVRLSVPPTYGVQLLAWGTDPAGEWWALVTWERFVAAGWETPTQVWCSGWTSSSHVGRVEDEDYTRVPRVRLDADQRWWPSPPGPGGVHYGLLDSTTPLDPPAGFVWKTPRYSKRR
jgi:hypothetical protein